jgi:hypothetical protein
MVTGSTVDWDKMVTAIQLKLAEAVINGGVVTYVINGRSVTRSITELREMLKVAESRAPSQGGGIVCQLGEFP